MKNLTLFYILIFFSINMLSANSKAANRCSELFSSNNPFNSALFSNRLLESDIHPVDHATIVYRQNQLEASLKRQVQYKVESTLGHNVKSNLTNSELIFLLPSQKQYDLTLTILRSSTHKSEVVEFVTSLSNPTPSIVKAVREYFVKYRFAEKYKDRSWKFKNRDLEKMFTEGRLYSFYPEVKNFKNAKKKFTLKLFLLLISKTTFSEVDYQESSKSFQNLFGFHPFGSISAITKALTSRNLENIKLAIVQSYYEVTGYSSMYYSKHVRGAQQVEYDVPNLLKNMEKHLREGGQKLTSFFRRVIAELWFFETSEIQEVRALAIKVADKDKGFYDLRVEIHNLPTKELLQRVKNYKYVGNEKGRQHLEVLIEKMEGYLLTPNITIVKQLEKLIGDQTGVDYFERRLNKSSDLDTFRLVLDVWKSEWRGMIERSSVEYPQMTFYKGSQIFSDYLVGLGKRLVDQSGRSKDPNKLLDVLDLVFEHMVLDGHLNKNNISTLKAEIRKILDQPWSQEKKRYFIGMVLQSAINTVNYRMLDDFSAYDSFFELTSRFDGKARPTKFVDQQLRVSSLMVLGEITTRLMAGSSEVTLNNSKVNGQVEVYNKGVAEGRLRIEPEMSTVQPTDIIVVKSLPPEIPPVAGVISVNSGARLSHVQLLAQSLGIPNVKIDNVVFGLIKTLGGQQVQYVSEAGNKISIKEKNQIKLKSKVGNIKVPEPDYSVSHPIAFSQIVEKGLPQIAGPKGLKLSEMYGNSRLRHAVPNGYVLPFGFFKKYSDKTGLTPLLNLLSKIDLENKTLTTLISNKIQKHIEEAPIPEDMINDVMNYHKWLKKSNPDSKGFFFRSDTNIEDLPTFNGAGLNESVPNVGTRKSDVETAIKTVWVSPFKEKSISWRGVALNSKKVSLAIPSVVVLPTIEAKSSGVLISRGGKNWKQGKGSLSANWGIGSVVESSRPVEEYTLNADTPIKISTTVSRNIPVAQEGGGMILKSTNNEQSVLSIQQVNEINSYGKVVEEVLGTEKHGWDIEWAIDQNNQFKILQARPNQ